MKHNFGAGPCILPQEVFKQASQGVLEFNNTGLSILEISHRAPEFVAVMDEAIALVKELLNVPAGYSVVFLQGGASLQFTMVAMNLLPEGKKASYLDTGVWSKKAIAEAKLFGEVEVVASSKDKNYSYIPKDYTVASDSEYFHFTSNNTIFGTQFQSFPKVNVPLVCDMSSDIFSKEINVADFDLIYAGAQKNIGPAGATLVIVKDEILGKAGRIIPSMLDYQKQIEAESMYSTPPVFSVFVSMLNLRWLKSKGGVAEIGKENIAKANALYREIDRNPLFRGTVAVEDRSNMNVTFLLTNPDHTATFDALWKEAGISGLPGHRSVGGYRASMYNALAVESVQALVDCMKELENKI